MLVLNPVPVKRLRLEQCPALMGSHHQCHLASAQPEAGAPVPAAYAAREPPLPGHQLGRQDLQGASRSWVTLSSSHSVKRRCFKFPL